MLPRLGKGSGVVDVCPKSDGSDWLRRVIVALPGLFYYHLYVCPGLKNVYWRLLMKIKTSLNTALLFLWATEISARVAVHLHALMWTASSEFGTYRLCEQRRIRRACASAQSRQNLRCSLIQAVSQEEPSDRKSDPWPLWMAGHAQLKFVMTECSKTQIRLTGLMY